MTVSTITEVLAEIKSTDSKIKKKAEFVSKYLFRQESQKDPLAKDGGSESIIPKEVQSTLDLLERRVELRRVIAKANASTMLTVGETTRSIADWIVWKREVAKQKGDMLRGMLQGIQATRTNATQKGWRVTTEGKEPNDVVINVDELKLQRQLEEIDEILGVLDGKLSMKNATTQVEI
jgi:hypothetical protein